jgi:hypothetical protein
MLKCRNTQNTEPLGFRSGDGAHARPRMSGPPGRQNLALMLMNVILSLVSRRRRDRMRTVFQSTS